MHEQVRAMKFVPTLPKHAGDAEHVVAPGTGALLGQVVKVELEIAGEFFRVDRSAFDRARGDCDIGGESDGGGHDETVVVVGVFADQVDAAGRTEDSGTIAEALLETML